ncbi:hypothetical protein Taro_056906 [Colocasia esculenta]|uniref:Terpene synthase metal-binding domain-containing protein n=1 Tax=Colocasia esculenta TaxID=4460 RepID=A0A843XX14_COLES|nr:hypothetical protein [Colocasia esculenta]
MDQTFNYWHNSSLFPKYFLLFRWSKELGLIKKLSFARDRLEPHLAHGRMLMAKVICLTSILDDIYDSYGTLIEELLLLTDAMQRWDIVEVEGLPEYMKTYFMVLSDTIKEFEDMLLDGQKSYFVQYLKEEIKTIAKVYLKEAEYWCNEGHIPTLQDHLQVSIISSGTSLLICGFFLCMRDIATQDTFDWLASYPKIIEASAMITRLMGDISSHEFEENWQHVACTVRCYMEEYGVSKEMARKKLREMVDTAWKVMNEEWIKTTQIPLQLLAVPFRVCA